MDVNNVTTSDIGNRFDGGSLTTTGFSMKEESKRVWNSFRILPILASQEKLGVILDRLALLKEHILKITIGLKYMLGKNEMCLGKRICHSSAIFRIHFHIKIIQIRT